MAPVRSKKRTNANLLPVPGGHSQQYLSPSDIELELDHDLDPDSDYPMATEALPKPPLRTNEELNLQVLHKLNPEIRAIVSLATYAVIYTFSSGTQGWEKSGVEGTMFVVQLEPGSAERYGTNATEQPEERYAVFVLNRRGLENFMLELRNEDDVEITNEYVILQKVEDTADGLGSQESVIYGVWIFAEPEASTADARTFNAQVIQQCASQASMSRARLDQGYHELEKERLRIVEEQEMIKAMLEAQQERERLRVAAEWEAQQSRQAAERHFLEQQKAEFVAASARKTTLLDLFKAPTQSPLSSASSKPVSLLDLFKKPQLQPNQVAQSPLPQQQSHYPDNRQDRHYENRLHESGLYSQSPLNNDGRAPFQFQQQSHKPQQDPDPYDFTNQQSQTHQYPLQHNNQHQPSYQSQQYPQNHQNSNFPAHLHNQHVLSPQSFGNNQYTVPPPVLNATSQHIPPHTQGQPGQFGFHQPTQWLPSRAPINGQQNPPPDVNFARRFHSHQ